MFHTQAARRRAITIVGIALGLSLLVAGIVNAATNISQHDGPNYHANEGYYTFGVCSDTGFNEKVYMQYTTDGSNLTNPPDTGNGNKLLCMYTNSSVCVSYWTCTMADAPGHVINYRFYTTNSAGQYTNLATPQRTFTTGTLAVTLDELKADSVNDLSTAIVIAVLSIIGIAILIGALNRRRASI